MGAQPEPWKSLAARIYKIEEMLRGAVNRSPFFGTGMHANGDGGIDSDNFVAGTSGYSFKADGNAEFNDLTLRGGIIGNDALAEPVVPQVARLSASGFSLTTTHVNKDSASLTVPSGCTRLLASVQGRLYVVNSNTTGGADGTGTEAIYVRLTVGANQSTATPTGVSGSFGFASTTGQDAFLLTGLTPGESVTFAVAGKCGYSSIPAYVDNYIIATATLIWLR